MYDYLIVGAGLFGAVFAHEAQKAGKKVLVIDKRNHIGGNCYTENWDGINIHLYGAHVFKTSNITVWKYINQFAEFNNYLNSPIAKYNNEIYNLPFNMNTFHRMWGCMTPDDAREKINSQKCGIKAPANLEEKCISLVGKDIYEKLVKGYTEKQWGRECKSLPADIIKRIPVRFTYDNNYYNDRYQGIPNGGYTNIFIKLLEGCEILLNTDYMDNEKEYTNISKCIIYTGPIDEFYHYRFGPLEYRGLRFEHKKLATDNYQGVAVVNYTDKDTPYTRSIEHKHFEFGQQSNTVVSYEYPCKVEGGIEPFYPINDVRNNLIYQEYKRLSENNKNLYFCGRLGGYKYTDMQETIENALSLAEELIYGE